MIPDPLIGWIPEEPRWAPSIRYLLRRLRIVEAISSLPRGRYLEVGCGAGTLLAEISVSGFECVGMESSTQALDIARSIIQESGESIDLVDAPACDWHRTFDLLGAFDVLEHVQDDAATLDAWVAWLAPRGTMLLTVPAHTSRWGAGDVWAGHYRRYDRPRLVELIESAGLRINHIECYGFPLANMTEFVGEFYYQRALRRRAHMNLSNRSVGNALSGVDRVEYRRMAKLIRSTLGRALLRLADAAQEATLSTDWGSGYLLSASRP